MNTTGTLFLAGLQKRLGSVGNAPRGRVQSAGLHSISLDGHALWQGSVERMQEMFEKLAGQSVKGQTYLDFLEGVECGLGARCPSGLWGRISLHDADGRSRDCVLLAPAPARLRLAVEPLNGTYRFGWVATDGQFVRDRSATSDDVRRSGYADLKHLALLFESDGSVTACVRMLRVSGTEVLYMGPEDTVLYANEDGKYRPVRSDGSVGGAEEDVWRCSELEFFVQNESRFPHAFTHCSAENPLEGFENGESWLVCGKTDGGFIVTNGWQEHICSLAELFSRYAFPALRNSALHMVQMGEGGVSFDGGYAPLDASPDSAGTFL